MIGFDHQGLAALQLLQDMVARVAQVGEHSQVGRTVRAAQLQRFAGIVGHREGQRLEGAHVDAFHVVGDVQQSIKVRGSQGIVRALAHPYRNAKARGHRLRAANVVGMLVGDEDGVQIFDLQLRLGQPCLQLPDAQTAINEQAAHLGAAAAFHDRGVAGAAAPQILEAQHGVVRESLAAGLPAPYRAQEGCGCQGALPATSGRP